MKTLATTDTIVAAIELLQKAAYENARAHGFWDSEDKLIAMAESAPEQRGVGAMGLTEAIRRIVQLGDIEKIALEHSELSERLEQLRKDPEGMDSHCPEFRNVEIEVADIIIRALDWSGRRNLRIAEAILAKMEYNSTRPFKHNKAF